MSGLRLNMLKCAILAVAAHLFVQPAVADNVSAGGFIIIDSKPLSLHLRSTHRVHRYYGAPKVYHEKSKPTVYHDKPKDKKYRHTKKRLHHVKPVKRYHRSANKFPRPSGTAYHIPQRYGIQRRTFGYGHSRSRY
ncbi:hypothetical protein [Ruegeria atlantica]|uniref:hypothetical protein n=1 Tax=Ruegeria atlantica TaxID=81569 RepID=UPI00147D397C|nr:hypothetical protein [Ruegeria atlantica]